jgi:hypothetical protein
MRGDLEMAFSKVDRRALLDAAVEVVVETRSCLPSIEMPTVAHLAARGEREQMPSRRRREVAQIVEYGHFSLACDAWDRDQVVAAVKPPP